MPCPLTCSGGEQGAAGLEPEQQGEQGTTQGGGSSRARPGVTVGGGGAHYSEQWGKGAGSDAGLHLWPSPTCYFASLIY